VQTRTAKDPNPDAWIDDRSKRVSDSFNARITFMKWDEIQHAWMAFKLSDGSTDGNIYYSRREAIRHQVDERVCAYLAFMNCPNGIKPSEAGRFLYFTEMAYKGGAVLPDPDQQFGGREAFMPTEQYDNLKSLPILNARGLLQ
jgi:hypothetical protein